MTDASGQRRLIEQASRAAFWNATLLPLLSILNLAFAIVLRRSFGLFSGVYDIVLGLLNSILIYSSLGIPTSLTKFLPEMELEAGPGGVVAFLRRAVTARMAILMLALLPLNLFADAIAVHLDLGQGGPLLLRLVSLLAIARALLELAIKTLNAFFAQLWANLLSLLQATLDFALVAAALIAGFRMAGVLGALVASSAMLAILGGGFVAALLRRLHAAHDDSAFGPASQERDQEQGRGQSPEQSREEGREQSQEQNPGQDQERNREGSEGLEQSLKDVAGEDARFGRFALFTYVFELSLYFSGAGFASLALAAVLVDHEQVALFATGFKLAFMTIGIVVAGFRGLYRPIFARLRAQDDPPQLQRAFVALSKAQLALLLPAGVGLTVMAGDYVPLFFGEEFLPAIPIARVLVALMFAETAFNLGIIYMSIDERYRAVLGIQSILVLSAPVFLLVAYWLGLTAAALVFGMARLAVTFSGYLYCRDRYAFRFPWRFAARVAMVSAVMGLVLAFARSYWPTSIAEAVGLTLAGMVVFGIGIRLAAVLGKEEVDLLKRSRLPGGRWLISWLSPGGNEEV